MTQQRHDSLVGQALNKRAGHTDDVAATIRWLTSPDAGHVAANHPGERRCVAWPLTRATPHDC